MFLVPYLGLYDYLAPLHFFCLIKFHYFSSFLQFVQFTIIWLYYLELGEYRVCFLISFEFKYLKNKAIAPIET